MSSPKTVASLAILVALGAFAGCSAKGVSDVELADQASPTEQGPGSVTLPPPSQQPAETEDGSAPPPPKDAGLDAKPSKDASVDAGPPAPEPGETCAVPNKIFARKCGACGTQEALCIGGDPNAEAGATGIVSDYSPCRDEIPESAGGCVPGTTVTEACGNCGTLVKTCPNTCVWKKDACKGEPLESCSAGTVAWATAGCPTLGTVRQRDCNATCTWNTFAECTPPAYTLTAPSKVGDVAKGIFPFSTSRMSKRASGNCGETAVLSATDKHPFIAVEVRNPTAQAVTISAWNSAAPNGGKVIDTVMAAYKTLPTTDEEVKACLKGWGELSINNLPCGDSKFAALTGTTAVTIGANESVFVYFTTAKAHPTLNEVTEGPVQLSIRTDALVNP